MLVILISVTLISVYIIKLVDDFAFDEKKLDLTLKANILSSFAANSNFDEEEDIAKIKSYVEMVGDVRVIYLDKDSRVVYDTSHSLFLKGKIMIVPIISEALGGVDSIERMQENGNYYINVAVPVTKEGNTIGVIYLQSTADDMEEYLSRIRQNLFALSVVICIIVCLLSFALSNLFTAPVENMTAAIKYMSENEQREELDIRGSNEINELVDEFNKLVARINLVEERRQEFVSNASHELKTPLSSIKLVCDSILQNSDVDRDTINDFLFDMNDEVDRLTRITNKLLTLTKMDVSVQESSLIDHSLINVKSLIRRIVKALKPLADEKKIKFEVVLPEDVYASIDADKTWEAIYNLLDNSIKYTGEGGWVYIEMYREGRFMFITVADNGIGMAESEKEKVFDRFYRIDKARARETGGTGLGLSIAKSSVELHGGNIVVESHEGEGSLFRIIMPTVSRTPSNQSESVS